MDSHRSSATNGEFSFPLSRRRFIAGSLLTPIGLGAPSLLNSRAAAAADSEVSFTPVPLNDGLSIGEPDTIGINTSALRVALQGVREGAANIHSVLVMRNGKLAAEIYRTGSDRSLYSLWASRTHFQPTDRHDMRSVSKSVTSLLYGILFARGNVPDLDTSVPTLYPECTELNDPSRSEPRQQLSTYTSMGPISSSSPLKPNASLV